MTGPSPSKRSAFSLIELMVVLAVVGLLLAFAAPNLFSLISANTLTGEGTLLRNQFTYAQQMAVSKSADVEVRFFKFKDADSARTEESFGAYQLFQYNQDGEMAPVSTLFRIRAPVAVHRESTLLDPSANSATAKDKKFGYAAPTTGRYDAPTGSGGEIVSTEYVAFRFRPDGSTDLPNRSRGGGDTWYIVLVQGEGAIDIRLDSTSEEERIHNFVCLQVNPYNGQIAEFRP